MVHVPVSHVDAAGLSWLLDNNLLLIGSLLLSVATAFLCFKMPSRCHPRALAALAAVSAALFVAGLAIEHYNYLECPVGSERREITELILRRNVQFFADQPESWRQAHPSHISDGTLLAFVRKRTSLIVWDQDTDIHFLYDLEQDPGAKELLGKLNERTEPPFAVVYRPERGLIQVTHPCGAHGDIWLLQRKEINGVDCLYNLDYSYANRKPIPGCFGVDISLPTEARTWNLGATPLQVNIPKDLHAWLTSSFGPRYIEPYHNRIQCMENFMVHADRSWFWCYAILIVVTSAYVFRTSESWLETKRRGGVAHPFKLMGL
ncbi:hypothetical protein DIPPA_21749 [Diplonema papillatum]|nr:hypothetical protein DIPPA_21749 [Diplonema papillatum]